MATELKRATFADWPNSVTTQEEMATAVAMCLRSKRYEVKSEITFTCDPGDPGDPRGSLETFTASAQVDEIPRKKRAAK